MAASPFAAEVVEEDEAGEDQGDRQIPRLELPSNGTEEGAQDESPIAAVPALNLPQNEAEGDAGAPVSRERFAVEVAYVELMEPVDKPNSGEVGATKPRKGKMRGLRMPTGKRKPKPVAVFHLKISDRLKNAEWLCERRRSDFANLSKSLSTLMPDVKVPAPKPTHTGLLGLGGHAPVETERQQLDDFAKRVCALEVFWIPESFCTQLPFWVDTRPPRASPATPRERVGLAKYEADTWLEPDTAGAALLEFVSRDAQARVDLAAGKAEEKQKFEATGRQISLRSTRSLKRLSTGFVESRVEQWVTQQITNSTRGIMQAPSASAQDQAAQALDELLSTERSYLSKLMWCVQKYKIPLELRAKDGEAGSTVLTMEEIAALFGNLEEVRDVAKGMVQHWQGLSAAGELDSSRAAEAVEQCLPQFLTVYRRYTRNFAGFAPLYASLKENSEFVAFEREAERDSRAEYQTLIDVLIMPVQRVPRVKMLFHEMLKGEDNLATGARLRDIEDSLDAVLSEINSSMDES
jgi:RhoGEF domain/PX domain